MLSEVVALVVTAIVAIGKRRRRRAAGARRRMVAAGRFVIMRIVFVLGEEVLPQMDGSQSAADDGRCEDNDIGDDPENNPRSSRGNAGVIGEVLGSRLHLSQGRRSWRMRDALGPAHRRTLPRSMG